MNTSTVFHAPPKPAAEEVSEIFRTNLLQLRKERKIPARVLSRKAGLNDRAVKDIEERRASSPRIVTVFKLAEALDVTPQDLLGLEKCHCSAGDLIGGPDRRRRQGYDAGEGQGSISSS